MQNTDPLPSAFPVSAPPAPAAPASTALHLPSLLQALGSAAAAFAYGLVGLLAMGFGLFDQDPGLGLVGGLALLLGGLILPSLYYAARRLVRPDLPNPPLAWGRLGIAAFLFPVAVLGGMALAEIPAAAWLLPPFFVLGIGLPQAWLITLGARNLRALSRQRVAGVLGFSLSVTPLLILIIELLFGAVALVGVAMLLSGEAGFMEQLERFMLQVQAGLALSEEALLDFATRYLVQPGVVGIGLLFAAVAVPLLEEALKPLAVYLLAGRNLSPASGFIAGMITGAAFGLFESLGLSGNGQDFAYVVGVRMGTSLLHIVTAGLTGWGVALAVQSRRPGPLLKRFAGAVALHALWNGLTVLAVVGELPGGSSILGDMPWSVISSIGLLGLFLVSFFTLIRTNRTLLAQQAAEAAKLAALAAAAESLAPDPEPVSAPPGESAL